MKLKNKKEAKDLILEIEDLLVLKQVDGKPHLGIAAHDPSLHEETANQDDPMQRYCPQCFTINSMKRLRQLIEDTD